MMKNCIRLLIVVSALLPTLLNAQNVAINNNGAAPVASAALDLNPTTKGLLLPRLTNIQRNAIGQPAAGLLIYNTSANAVQYWNGTGWVDFTAPGSAAVSNAAGTSTGRSVAMGAANAVPDQSAVLDVQSTTGGLLLPRVTTVQRDAIASPVEGLLVFNTTTKELNIYASAGWKVLCGTQGSSVTGAIVTTNNVGINTASPDGSAMLDITSTKGGLALPRLTTTQRDAILSPAKGLMLFNTTTGAINVFTSATNVAVLTPAASCVSTFTCGSVLTDTRDSKTYNTVLIGTQCWMAQNLNYGTYMAASQGGQTVGKKYCYDDIALNCDTYGGMYEWNIMMNNSAGCNGTGSAQQKCTTPVQGICPTGWHIPSHYEWTLLERTLCTSGTCATDFPYDATTGITVNIGTWRGTDEGAKLKEAGTTHWKPTNSGTNTSGFTALPTGAFVFSSWNFLNSAITDGYWWSSSNNPNDNTEAIFRQMEYGPTNIQRSAWPKDLSMGVRCVKD